LELLNLLRIFVDLLDVIIKELEDGYSSEHLLLYNSFCNWFELVIVF